MGWHGAQVTAGGHRAHASPGVPQPGKPRQHAAWRRRRVRFADFDRAHTLLTRNVWSRSGPAERGPRMLRRRVKELHYITHVDNLASICARGVLSHQRARRVRHRSVASEEIQNRRARKRLPNGARLHSYANLYFDARNPMMYRL